MSDFGGYHLLLCEHVRVRSQSCHYRAGIYCFGDRDRFTGVVPDNLHLPRSEGQARISLFKHPII